MQGLAQIGVKGLIVKGEVKVGMDAFKGNQGNGAGLVVGKKLLAASGFRRIGNGQTQEMYVFIGEQAGEQKFEYGQVPGKNFTFIACAVKDAKVVGAAVAQDLENLDGQRNLSALPEGVCGRVLFPGPAHGTPVFGQ